MKLVVNGNQRNNYISISISISNSATFRTSLFYKGPMLSISPINSIITIPKSLFSIKIYKNSAKRELIKSQSLGDSEEWPTFILNNVPGLRKSPRNAT